MLKVRIIVVGKQKERWMRDGTAEYLKRLSAYCAPEVIELPEAHLPENPAPALVAQALEKEGREILRRAAGSLLVPLCIEGEQLSSEELAEQLAEMAQKSSAVSFVIGSSCGLAPEVKAAGVLRLSMSKLTFPHQLARLMLTEQLYRACSINAGGKYHK